MVRSVKVGQFELVSLQVWPLEQIPVREVLVGVDPHQLEQTRVRQPQFFGPTAELAEFTQNIFVVRSPHQTVLIDTGFPLQKAGAILQWGLGAIGLQPGDIDLVFLSHRDDDHVGGTVDLQGKPLYPKARYLISRSEYADFKADTARAKGFEAWIKPLEDQGVLELLEDGVEIATGLATVPTPGHRSHATSLRIQDGNESALLLADTLHIPAQVTYPDWSSVWDWDKDMAAQTRQQVVEQAEYQGLLLAAPHIPFGGLGYVKQEDGSRIWSPIVQG